ncbi:agrin-like [Antedon mediterranea]|uniref:agrin-like n=1 Tax=Antedon mediterranea TaxID=105859 RepID=UPI003AF971D4
MQCFVLLGVLCLFALSAAEPWPYTYGAVQDCASASVCESDGSPVCGTNQVTYDNYCELLKAVCEEPRVNQYVTVRYEGTCGYPRSCLWEGQEYGYGRAVEGNCGNMCICQGGRNRWYCNPCPDPRDSNCAAPRSCPDYGVYCNFLRPIDPNGCQAPNCECMAYEIYLYLYHLQIWFDQFKPREDESGASGEGSGSGADLETLFAEAKFSPSFLPKSINKRDLEADLRRMMKDLF